jgi:hypothetical protein
MSTFEDVNTESTAITKSGIVAKQLVPHSIADEHLSADSTRPSHVNGVYGVMVIIWGGYMYQRHRRETSRRGTLLLTSSPIRTLLLLLRSLFLPFIPSAL